MERKISLKVCQLFKHCLGTTTVYVGSAGELLLVAAIVENGKSIKVHSDKGFEHVLLLLCKAVVSNSVEIDKELTSTKYLYPVSVLAENFIENMIEGNYVTISLEEGIYTVTIQNTRVPSLGSPPGIYRKSAKGLSIEDAFMKVQNSSFVLRT